MRQLHPGQPFRLVTILLVFNLALVAAVIMFWPQIEKKFVFFPSADLVDTLDRLGVDHEDISIVTDDGVELHGWYIPGSSDFTWLWFHGNGGNISHRVDELALMHHRLGVNLLIIDYRGYGRSAGKPSESGTYQDARAALRYLQHDRQVPPGKMVYFGHSLGSAVAVELAEAHPPAGLVLISPFTSMRDMARLSFPYLPLLGWLIGDRYNSHARMGGIHSALLVIHGDQDETVPWSQGKKLFEAANQPKYFNVLSGTGHNDTYSSGGESYWRALEDFQSRLQGRLDVSQPR